MIQSLAKFAGTAVLGLAATVAAPTASAAIVTGSWDPALPAATFTSLGWTTTINIKISDDCIRDDGSTPLIRYVNVMGKKFNCGPSQGTGEGVTPAFFSILSAEIGLYDLGSQRIIDVLTFNPLSFSLGFLELGEGGSILQLIAGDASPIAGDVTGRTLGFDFVLGLPGAAPVIKYRSGSTGSFTTGTEPPTQTAFVVNADSAEATVLADTKLDVGDLIFTGTVPEPGSLALTLLALGAAGAVATRRQRHAA